MAHEAQQEWLRMIRDRYPRHFKFVRVLDCGSLDINGSNAWAWDIRCGYTGIDLAPGKNVHAVMPMEDADWPDGHFHVCISTECLEHNAAWKAGLQNMLRMLRPGGLMMVSCATTGRAEHGTKTHSPNASPFTAETEYYQNLTEDDFRDALDMDEFDHYEFDIREDIGDLYFHGVKKGELVYGSTCGS